MPVRAAAPFARRRAGIAIALACAAPAWMQPARAGEPAPPDLRIEVTGSNIKRQNDAAVAPIQTITREELDRMGVLTAAQLLERIAANLSFNGYAEAQAIGDAAQPGFAGASLRGLGYSRTLVLLDGRRVANYALNSAGVDLNSIPLAAVDRVEVLKDGASAIYGSDALAGVINFITRASYQGAEASAFTGATQAGGGRQARIGIAAGIGDAARDRVNAFGVLDVQDYGGLRAVDRRFARTALIPGILDATSGSSIPANIEIPGGTASPRNPQCDPPTSFATPAAPRQCRYDYVRDIDLLPPSRRFNALGRAGVELSAAARAFVEGAYSRNDFTFHVAPTPVSSATNLSGRPFLLPPSSPYYPAAFVEANGGDATQPVSVLWRASELGPRINETRSEQYRVVAGLDGVAYGWDFDTALQYNVSKVRDRYVEGWARESQILPLLDSGIVDPFGPNAPGVVAALRATTIDQEVRSATGTTYGADGKLGNRFRGPAGTYWALALGADWRRESLTQRSADVLSSGDILGSGGDIPSISTHARDVAAGYAEIEKTVLQALTANVAVRYDRYSDFGGTTSPKLGLRWQPLASLALRGTWGTGFRAPSLQGLYQPLTQTNTAGVWDDPLRCPITHSATDCAVQFNALVGGNPGLAPERSRQYSVGVTWTPTQASGVAINRWRIVVQDLITTLSDVAVFTQYDLYAPTSVRRGPPDPSRPGLPGPIIAVVLPTTNLGRQDVAGTDFDARVGGTLGAGGRVDAAFSGTYFDRFEQTTAGGEYPNFAGTRGAIGAIPRWRHYATATWSQGAWAATLAQTFQESYDEPDTTLGRRRVGAYSLWDLQAQYAGWRDLVLALGVRNLFDRDPPLSNQNQAFQVGYDPSYADPRGRFFYASARYTFR